MHRNGYVSAAARAALAASGSFVPPTEMATPKVSATTIHQPKATKKAAPAAVAPVQMLGAAKDSQANRKERQHQYYLANRDRIREQRMMKKRLEHLRECFGASSIEVEEEQARQDSLKGKGPSDAEIATFALGSMDAEPDTFLVNPPTPSPKPTTNSYFYRRARDFDADVIYAREQMELKLAKMAEKRTQGAVMAAAAAATTASPLKKAKGSKSR